jgi:hypothetical protein
LNRTILGVGKHAGAGLCRRKGGRLGHSGHNQQKVSHGHREIHRQ